MESSLHVKQLLDCPQITETSEKLLNVLQDIANKIEIQSKFSVHHPDYKPWELSTEGIDRLQQMPQALQRKFLSLQLRSFLYGIYYNGAMRSVLAPETDEKAPPLDLENNMVLGVDVKFYQRLHDSNRGIGYFEPGWRILRAEKDGSLAVTKGSLRLHLDREKHLQPSEQAVIEGDSVAIRLPKNRLQRGFYIAVGNAGVHHLNSSEIEPITVRIYFNLTSEGAVAIMDSLTRQLNEVEVPFSFKVLYNPKDYDRYDSGVLYFDKRDYGLVREVLQPLYRKNESHFKPNVPLFTLELAPGLGLAEEPDKKFEEQESFGTNRCQIVANGLLEAWYQGDNSTTGRMQSILKEFSHVGIDWQHAHLNAGSEDIYTWLA
jgi:HopA1 effector protein family